MDQLDVAGKTITAVHIQTRLIGSHTIGPKGNQWSTQPPVSAVARETTGHWKVARAIAATATVYIYTARLSLATSTSPSTLQKHQNFRDSLSWERDSLSWHLQDSDNEVCNGEQGIHGGDAGRAMELKEQVAKPCSAAAKRSLPVVTVRSPAGKVDGVPVAAEESLRMVMYLSCWGPC
uniref:Uncharacterized protein n=1 Tax=Avena sativa TaxID=4498 RepID=A0ACD5YZ43_AVESA